MNLSERIQAEERANREPDGGLPRTRIVTVRMPAELYERLMTLRCAHRLSMNRLCILMIEQGCGELENAAAPDPATEAA